MFWADRITKEIIQSGRKSYRVDDMFTPSGFAHIGSLRGPLVHDLVTKALRDAKEEPLYTFIINDFDPVDGLPQDLQEKFGKYLGFPLYVTPSPDLDSDSFADYFAKDFKKVLSSLGMEAKFLSSWDIYHEGKFDNVIREALNNSEVIQDIYKRVSGSKKGEKGWLPLQVICENCGRLGTTKVNAWDGEIVTYTCEENLVTWAKGCGYSGKISPFGGNGKLPWKVDWPAHWKVLGITIEGAGKDHSSAGGSRDIAREICNEVFNYPEPYNLPYEFFLLGGKKMSSSKGLGLKARDLIGVLPPNLARFLFVRTDYKEAIEFNPSGTLAIPDLFDEYDRLWNAYNNDTDEVLSRTFVLSQTGKVPEKKKVFLSRFRDVANYVQLPNINLENKFSEIKGEALSEYEKNILKEREKYARIWLENYAPEESRIEMTKTLPDLARHLSEGQKKFLAEAVQIVEKEDEADELQIKLYNSSKEMKLNAKEAFAAIYISFMGRESGPKAAWFLLQYPKDIVIRRLIEASESKEEVL